MRDTDIEHERMTRPPRRSSSNALLTVGVAAALVVLCACTSPTSSAVAPAETVAVAPAVSGTLAPTATLQPSTTEEATSTVPASTTTTVPATTTTTVPANIINVGVFAVPIVPVGSSSGPDTLVLQLRLQQLGFWSAPADGKYDLSTKQAVMAFQKYLYLDPTGSVDDATAAFLTQVQLKAHGLVDTGTLVEVDKARQLLFIVVDGVTLWTINTSTGNGKPFDEPDMNTPGGPNITGVALTPDGVWKVNRERPEGWWEGDLGRIYRPKYFHGGIAIHGSNSIPNYPASHGCVRVSVPAMDFIWASGLVPMQMPVWVHS